MCVCQEKGFKNDTLGSRPFLFFLAFYKHTDYLKNIIDRLSDKKHFLIAAPPYRSSSLHIMVKGRYYLVWISFNVFKNYSKSQFKPFALVTSNPVLTKHEQTANLQPALQPRTAHVIRTA